MKQNKILGRKGFLFSISTVMLLISLLVLSYVYVERTTSVVYDQSENAWAGKLRYIEDDVVAGVYQDLLPILVNSIERSGGLVTVNFNDIIRLEDSRDFDDRMSSYESFIEGIYSNLHNVNINLENFTANVTIDPYDSIVDLNQNDILVYNDADNLDNMIVKFKVNEQNPGLLSDTTTTGSTNVRLILLNEDDVVQEDTTFAIDPTAQNTFVYTAQTTDLFMVTFGNFLTYPDATLYVNASSYTEILQLQLAFNENEQQTVIRGGKIGISSATSNLSISHAIVLVEE